MVAWVIIIRTIVEDVVVVHGAEGARSRVIPEGGVERDCC